MPPIKASFQMGSLSLLLLILLASSGIIGCAEKPPATLEECKARLQAERDAVVMRYKKIGENYPRQSAERVWLGQAAEVLAREDYEHFASICKTAAEEFTDNGSQDLRSLEKSLNDIRNKYVKWERDLTGRSDQ